MVENNIIRRLYWRLPYEVRRAVYRVKYPIKYQLLQSLRAEIPEKLTQSTYKPFIENNCIFIHIPKTAGISISNSLFGRHTGNHARIKEYKIIFNKKEFNSFFKFTFVRNPWDRLLSAFIYLKNGGRNKEDYLWAEKHLSPYRSFNDFVLQWVNKRNIDKGIHFMPQYKFLTTLKNFKPEVDFIGLFENIHNDYEYVRNMLHMDRKLIFENKTEGKIGDYRSYYTDKIIEIVFNVYNEDIMFFGYDFENTSLEKQLSNRSI